MRKFFVCDICNESYNTEEEALSCENKHKEEEVQKKARAEQKSKDLEEINTLVDAFYEKYKEYPVCKVRKIKLEDFWDSLQREVFHF